MPPKPRKISVFGRLLTLLKPYRRLFVGALLLTLLLSVLMTVRPYLIKYILDGPIATGDAAGLLTWSMVFLGLLLGTAGVSYVQTYATSWIGQTVMNDLRLQVFNHLMRLRIQFYDRTPIGTLQTRTISDIETLNNVFSEGLVRILGDLLQVFLFIGMMLWLDWRVTLVVLSVIPLMIGVTYIFQIKVKDAFQRVRKSVAALNAFLQEHITGMLTTQMFSREAEEARRFRKINDDQLVANLDSVKYYAIFFPAVELLSSLATALLVWYGSGRLLNSQIDFGTWTAMMLYIQMVFRPIRMLADQINTLQYGLVSGERIFALLDTHDFIPEPTAPVAPPNSQAPPPALCFDRVSFGYQANEPVLHDISFDVPSGTTTALVGATGSGKSTLVSLLMRYYDLPADGSGGTIRLGAHDVRQYRTADLRSTLGLVMQDVFLFSGSIHDNITLQNPAISRARVEECARLVGAHHFIERLPGGYDYPVGERGATLAAGQRQLLNFVRILVYDPQVLLLDEATANIDTETEQLIQRAVRTVLQGRTALVVAHRLSTIQHADQIIVLHKGRLRERGTHAELLSQGGLYHTLYELQHAQPHVA